MIIGEFPGKLAEKNRIALPKKFREEFDGEMIITRGYEGCLIILDEDRWKNLINRIEQKPFLNLNVRDTKRFLVGGANELQLDSQGRFLLPNNLKDYGKIDKDVVFVGLMDWVELWAIESWNERLQMLTNSASQIADRLGEI